MTQSQSFSGPLSLGFHLLIGFSGGVAPSPLVETGRIGGKCREWGCLSPVGIKLTLFSFFLLLVWERQLPRSLHVKAKTGRPLFLIFFLFCNIKIIIFISLSLREHSFSSMVGLCVEIRLFLSFNGDCWNFETRFFKGLEDNTGKLSSQRLSGL